MEPIVITALVWLFIGLGIIGTVLPVLPGIGLIYAGILLYAFSSGIETVGIVTLVIFGIVTVLSMVVDYLASAYGASRFGATRWGMLGSVIGGIIGLIILSLPGLLLGVFAGAAAGEMLFAKKDATASLRAGYGSILGFLGGTVLKVVLALLMVGIFVFKVWG